MAIIEFLGPINRENLEVDIKTLQELKDKFVQDKELQEWLDICAVAVNDSIVNSLDTKINPSDRISLLPPVCGG